MKVAVVKYNAGNIRSVDYALKRLGVEAVITADKEELQSADKVIFPGVGEAETTMNHLKATGLDELIKNLRQPVFGICLGMQLMCRHSEEGEVDCLNIFDVDVKRFVPQKHEDKVPHMGWNTIGKTNSKLFEGFTEEEFVYFVHSFYVPTCDFTAATTDYIHPFSAALHKDNFYATQFHPEKSGKTGEKKEFEANGVRRLHVVDLDGAASHHVVNYRVLEQIAVRTSLVIDFGGGVKSDEDLKIAFESGAQMVTGGSIAVKDPELFCHWLEIYGSEKIILGADVKEHKIAVNGWKDESACELFPFLENYIDKGIRKVICTDISCDGMLSGPSIDLYKEMLAKFPDLYLMASGGVSKVDDIVALDEAGVPGVIFGKALYEGHITLQDLRIFL